MSFMYKAFQVIKGLIQAHVIMQQSQLWKNVIKPLCTGGLFHCYMLDQSICHFLSVVSILSLLICF